MKKQTLILVVLGALLSAMAMGDEVSHEYQVNEKVVLWYNKVGPYYNPQETYSYYSLPFCRPKNVKTVHKGSDLGEALEGNELVSAGVFLQFRQDVAQAPICTKVITKEETHDFSYAVYNHYWYQMYLDDLPIWGMVGEIITSDDRKAPEHGPSTVEEELKRHADDQAYIYTHKSFHIGYSGPHIVEVNLTSENPTFSEPDANLVFTYSVKWVESDIAYEDRFQKYLDYDFFEHQIHWFSIVNSFMMVIFLVGLVSVILMRTLRKDYARYSKDEEEGYDVDVNDESGWKQVHGDVFRKPPHTALFAALIGIGYQLFFSVLFVILIATARTYYSSRGSALTTAIVVYALSSFIAGLASGSYYAKTGGQQWIRTFVIAAGMFPGIVATVILSLNFVAIAYESLAAMPFGAMLSVVALWLFGSIPLTLGGTLLGRNMKLGGESPCRINPIPRIIPEKKWYLRLWVAIPVSGILPFGSIFIEAYFVFTSFWNYKFYYVYGFMLLVFAILTIVAVCVTIVVIYFMLNAEDYRWQWISFGCGASTAGYLFLYVVYYFFAKTKMNGFFQTAFYFGYMILFCMGFAIVTGTLGFVGASLFVRRIFRNIKID